MTPEIDEGTAPEDIRPAQPRALRNLERAAGLTARILGGARPADLPFEEPTHYKLVINLKTAKATAIELPMNFLALADEVIE